METPINTPATTPDETCPACIFQRSYRLLIRAAGCLQSPVLLAIRLYWGWQFFITGRGKLMNIDKTADFFRELHIPMPAFNVCLAGGTECFGGLLLLAGLGSRLVSIPLIIVTVVAYLTAEISTVKNIFSDPDKFVSAAPFLFMMAAIIVLAFGPGVFSLDWLLEKTVFKKYKNSPSLTRLKTFPLALLCLVLSACAPDRLAPGDNVVKVDGATIHIAVDSNLAVPHAELAGWVRRGAVAVSGYLGRFPVKYLLIAVHTGEDQSPIEGVTHGNSRIDVSLAPSARAADLNQDWVMTHEMFHLAFPTLNRRYLWMMEGLSDYLEPVARARAGQLTARDAWKEFAEGLPQGLPAPGDRGLDNTRTRERIYWGGNLYWLLADVRIRVQTGNRRSVDDAIRAILAAGGTGGVDWPLDSVLTVGDKATGTTVLKDLHDELGPEPGNIDLDKLWKQLGVKYQAGVVSFDDTAPWAKIRASITAISGKIR